MIYLINKSIEVIIIINADFKTIKINKLLLNTSDKIQKNLFIFLNKFDPIDISNIDIQIIDINIINKYYFIYPNLSNYIF
jgi:hypothetical protein